MTFDGVVLFGVTSGAPTGAVFGAGRAFGVVTAVAFGDADGFAVVLIFVDLTFTPPAPTGFAAAFVRGDLEVTFGFAGSFVRDLSEAFFVAPCAFIADLPFRATVISMAKRKLINQYSLKGQVLEWHEVLQSPLITELFSRKPRPKPLVEGPYS